VLVVAVLLLVVLMSLVVAVDTASLRVLEGTGAVERGAGVADVAWPLLLLLLLVEVEVGLGAVEAQGVSGVGTASLLLLLLLLCVRIFASGVVYVAGSTELLLLLLEVPSVLLSPASEAL
jgi:hypothetical protein